MPRSREPLGLERGSDRRTTRSFAARAIEHSAAPSRNVPVRSGGKELAGERRSEDAGKEATHRRRCEVDEGRTDEALSEVITGVLELAAYGLRTGSVDVVVEEPPEPLTIMGDADQ